MESDARFYKRRANEEGRQPTMLSPRPLVSEG